MTTIDLNRERIILIGAGPSSVGHRELHRGFRVGVGRASTLDHLDAGFLHDHKALYPIRPEVHLICTLEWLAHNSKRALEVGRADNMSVFCHSFVGWHLGGSGPTALLWACEQNPDQILLVGFDCSAGPYLEQVRGFRQIRDEIAVPIFECGGSNLGVFPKH